MAGQLLLLLKLSLRFVAKVMEWEEEERFAK